MSIGNIQTQKTLPPHKAKKQRRKESMDLYKIDEKGTLKSTEHDEYENIAGSV
jgi:hypothetical protein